MSERQVLLVYDKECPACDFYCNIVNIRESVGELVLVDARESSEVMNEITERGLDIDQGMVLKIDDSLYYGSDAIHMLTLIGTKSGVFNRLNYIFFGSKTLSRIAYPVFKFFRNLLLKMLGKTKINNLKVSGNDRF